MNLEQAQPLVEAAVAKASQNMIAKEIGVDSAALSRWLRQMTVPTGKSKARIIEWAERQPPAPTHHTLDAETGYVALSGVARGSGGRLLGATLDVKPPTADYWRGVFSAAARMSETVTQLLHEASKGNPLQDFAGMDKAADEGLSTPTGLEDAPPETAQKKRA